MDRLKRDRFLNKSKFENLYNQRFFVFNFSHQLIIRLILIYILLKNCIINKKKL